MELKKQLCVKQHEPKDRIKEYTSLINVKSGDTVSKTATHKDYPWLNCDGSKKTNSEIQLLSESWTPETWERYLCTIETSQRETLFDEPLDVEEVSAEEYATMLFSFLERDEFPHLKAAINVGLRKLSPTQYQVVKLHFWDSKTKEDIARELNISRASVRTHVHRGLKKIKQLLEKQIIESKAKLSQRIFSKMDHPVAETETVSPIFPINRGE